MYFMHHTITYGNVVLSYSLKLKKCIFSVLFLFLTFTSTKTNSYLTVAVNIFFSISVACLHSR